MYVKNKEKRETKMKNSLAEIVSALMIVTVLLGFAAALPTFGSMPQPSAYMIVDPALSSFTTPNMVVGSTFNINVSLINITGVAGVQFTLSWDPTLLNCTGMTEVLFHTVTPSADWGNIWSLALDYNDTAGTANYVQTWLIPEAAQVDGYGPINVTTTTFPPDGKAVCATFTMKVLQVPTVAGENLTCAFHLSTVELADMNAEPISASAVDGTYIVAFAQAIIAPSSVTMDLGQSQLFTSTVSGGFSPYSYQWYLNEIPVPASANPTWTFTPSSSGSYNIFVQVTGNAGFSANSSLATVIVNQPPSVTISPSPVVMDIDQSQTFTSTVSGGTGPYSYQWYLNGAPQLGATAAAWTFTPLSAGSYIQICVNVTDSVGVQATSNNATITVNGAFSASISPSSATLDVGQSQPLTSTASGGTSPYTYEWYVNYAPVSGATYNMWVFTPTSSNSYTVYLNVTDSVGVIAISNMVTVAVNAAPTVSVAPVGPFALDFGQSEMFTATAGSGSGTLHYQWYLGDSPVGTDSPSYTFVASSAGPVQVYVNVTDSATTPYTVKSNVASITVNSAPSVAVSPSPVTLDVGQVQTFTASISGGTSPYAYQWYLDGNAVGTDNASYSYNATAGPHEVYVNVTDSASVPVTAESNLASVTVNSAVTVSITPASCIMDVGQTKLFTATVSGGTASFSYQWYLNGYAVSGATNATWTFAPTSVGSYTVYVKVTDSVGAQAMSNTSGVIASPAVPEFPSYFILPLFKAVALLAAFVLSALIILL